ncbi:APC family permease [Nitrospirillum sp. BR 11752]|uniref:APC family permease n=1 Tax=Nitrospirillum sp. BR 11752 TaxID=3104293 RepID=UPI002EC8C6B5|nr:APC family permease [Nitrospirillum sp. BR 11752]
MTPATEPPTPTALKPVRGIGLGGGLAANILNMVGIGPFITIPLAISAMGGPQAMLGWLVGAVLCAYDGLVWAELGSAFPRSGGPYHYLLHAFGPARLGRLFSFLYLWQSLLIGPLSIASGTVGLAQYASFLAPDMKPWHMMVVAAAVCLLNTALLYRDIRSIQRLSIGITVVVVAACVWIVLSGAWHFDAKLAFDFPEGAFKPTGAFWMGMGSATLIAVYDYGGYNNVCMIGEEIKNPSRTIPRAVLLSIAIVALLYLGLNLSILGTLPWQTAQKSDAVVAEFMQVIYGRWGGVLVSILILIASWGSALVVLLGFSRVPYTAAVDGRFFKPFATLHPKGRFPTVSLLFMGGASAVACFFSLADLIAVLIVIQTLFQFTAQCVAVVMLRRQGPAQPGQFRMPLYPLPVIVTIAGWMYIVATSQPRHIAIGVAMLALGVAVYLAQSWREGAWPFRLPAWRAP